MAQVGQTSQSGGREFGIYGAQAVLRVVTVPVAFTVNHIGLWCREQTTANENNLLAAIYASAGSLVTTSNELVASVGLSHALKQVTFSDTNVYSAGSYVLAVAAAPATTGLVIVSGQNGPGGSPVSMTVDPAFYPTFPSDYTTWADSAATRAWDLYLDYSEASGSAVPKIITSMSAFI